METSRCLWEERGDAEGLVHDIDQGEGGEQGDPMMPLLFSLGQHRALCEVQRRLRRDELMFAFLDDIYVKDISRKSVPSLQHSATGIVETPSHPSP